jgi:hypothetical protein
VSQQVVFPRAKSTVNVIPVKPWNWWFGDTEEASDSESDDDEAPRPFIGPILPAGHTTVYPKIIGARKPPRECMGKAVRFAGTEQELPEHVPGPGPREPTAALLPIAVPPGIGRRFYDYIRKSEICEALIGRAPRKNVAPVLSPLSPLSQRDHHIACSVAVDQAAMMKDANKLINSVELGSYGEITDRTQATFRIACRELTTRHTHNNVYTLTVMKPMLQAYIAQTESIAEFIDELDEEEATPWRARIMAWIKFLAMAVFLYRCWTDFAAFWFYGLFFTQDWQGVWDMRNVVHNYHCTWWWRIFGAKDAYVDILPPPCI